jgi:hypothetical protein
MHPSDHPALALLSLHIPGRLEDVTGSNPSASNVGLFCVKQEKHYKGSTKKVLFIMLQ